MSPSSEVNMLVLLLALLVGPVGDKYPPQQAILVRVIDGDTAVFDIDLGYNVHTIQHIRLEAFNAPELHGPNPVKAQAVKARLKELTEAKQLWVKPTGDQTFARFVARVYYEGVQGKLTDISQQLIDEGFNVPQGD